MIQFVQFPALNNANEDGLLAMGGDLSRDTLVSAYAQGIFPWFNHDQPILWWSPDPRMVLQPTQFKLSRSLRKTLKRTPFRVTVNTAFEQVISACALRGIESPNAPIADTWITESMHNAYLGLFAEGYAHSIEVWLDQRLVGGLYGVALGDVFFGESMFSRESDASKVGLFYLCQWLNHLNFKLIDCQVSSAHLISLGALEMSRTDFVDALQSIDIQRSKPNFSSGFERFANENVIKHYE
ncbi:leucyl/phenylalanyl-tRNA--protein transferase [Arenicella xantha]|uniref:Leucyl/phenylalanyl-tRNA--protein transferase n=1 Tax=Arenicella xantha TaxID=644221 RepID=A0A395JIN0_9GAMM|nr:leucyl/phenylalanyl-tRNA--protein transferase [Arenicella xantha]RBP48480.1 leucyl/phenylalanyl-tRNA--protein transferase [Arenicella xantha]